MSTHQQTQAPSDSPAPAAVEQKPQISEVGKSENEVQQATNVQEFVKQDPPASVFRNSEPLREDQIQNAIKFLSHPRVRGSPVIHRRSFLERKGLTKEEIDEAFRRVPDPPPSSPTVNSQDGQQAVSNAQPQGQIQAMQPMLAAPAPPAVAPHSPFLSHYRWYHAIIAIGVLAASGAGTAVFVKKSLIPRFKSWVHRIMLEEETDSLKEADAKPSLAEEAVAAAKAASAAASDVARVSQEMMKAKSEEMKCFEDFTNLLGAQVQELKSLTNNIRRLEGQSNNLPKLYAADQEVYNGSVTTAKKFYANGSNADYDSRSARSASPPAPPADSSAPPHPKSYMDIMSMIQRGEKPSNIREINDMPPNPNQQLPNPRIAPKTKPWDYGPTPQDESSNGPWWQQKNPRSTDFGYETTTAGRLTGNQNETSTMEAAPIQRQRSWVPPQPPPVVMPEAAEAIRRPKPQAKVTDQEAATSDDQTGVSDELQKITKFSEAGGDESGRLQISEIQEETEQQQPISQEEN